MSPEPIAAAFWRIEGRVQGVGFRPFVYRLARRHGLGGSVRNCGGVVEVLAEGPVAALARFERDLIRRAPPLARPQIGQRVQRQPGGATTFCIQTSRMQAGPDAHLPPDQFCCPDCLTELMNPADRRHGYPFINCTQCGPRYTLIRALPYDRQNTGMAEFPLCENCAAEYRDPLDRRFHAEPLACARCGPSLSWRTPGLEIQDNAQALAACIATLRKGLVIAVRGIGGYHLLCDAGNEAAVMRLRRRKQRPRKPLALMIPWRGADGLALARQLVHLNGEEASALAGPMRPILLARARHDSAAAGRLADNLAPDQTRLGLMLPYSPLHALLLQAFDAPLVATSGNLSGEPVITEVATAHRRLAAVADAFLDHDRPILRPADDPVLQFNAGHLRPLRLGRGNAPLELALPAALARPVLALGAYHKTTVALAWDRRVVISPHIGDLSSPRGRAVLQQLGEDLQHLYGVRAALIACDAHPDFPGSRWARTQSLPMRTIWHHHAHASAAWGEACDGAGDDTPWLCFCWDGTGYGEDASLWGGEALIGRPGHWQRVASLRPFRLPGGDAAAHEPWRTAASLCWSAGMSWAQAPAADLGLLKRAWQQGLNAPYTSAAGRLFDGASALLGLGHHNSFEAEAPMHLEAVSHTAELPPPLPLPLSTDPQGILRSDWQPLLELLLETAAPVASRAAAFHAGMAGVVRDQALALRAAHGIHRVALCGGVFQNRRLCEAACALLHAAGFSVHVPRQLPVNDAAISYGQVLEVLAQEMKS